MRTLAWALVLFSEKFLGKHGTSPQVFPPKMLSVKKKEKKQLLCAK